MASDFIRRNLQTLKNLESTEGMHIIDVKLLENAPTLLCPTIEGEVAINEEPSGINMLAQPETVKLIHSTSFQARLFEFFRKEGIKSRDFIQHPDVN